MPIDLTKVPIDKIKGISNIREKLFAGVGVFSVNDLLNYYPRSYQNRGCVKKACDIIDGETVSCILEITSSVTSARLKKSEVRHALSVQKVVASDQTGVVHITFFNRDFIKNTLKKSSVFRFYGTFYRKSGMLYITSPEFEPVYENVNLPELVPIYPLTKGLSRNIITTSIKTALLTYADEIHETLTDEFIEENKFISRKMAINQIHFPKSERHLFHARRRLAFEELYDFFLKTLSLGKRDRQGVSYRIKYPDIKAFANLLPFELTTAQKHAIQDILIDISTVRSLECESDALDKITYPSRRLIQGDVGSGKTVVACAAVYAVAKSGFQAALMVPTGILALQHYNELSKMLAPFGIECALVTGGMKTSEKNEVLFKIKSGKIKVVIGTHALIEDEVVFKNLALVVTDEQHRFGVMQRRALEEKGEKNNIKPHVVVMSATPIPRTLAMIMYCDLDISIIDSMPKGRQKVETYALGTEKRNAVYGKIAEHIRAGKQAYIVCPLAENNNAEVTSEMMQMLELNNAKEYSLSLSDTVLSEFRIKYIHGKMKQAEKDEIMSDFAGGKIDILVSTTVIEVGVNVPNATFMLIENAERFGLSQIHQLRGRVGRGTDKSYCVLMSSLIKKASKDSDFAKRMEIITENTSGFVIAEKDLELRGPGEFFGTRQSGDFRFSVANIISDMDLVKLARNKAQEEFEKK